MNLLVVHPGASWATHDVHVGLVEGLKANGVNVCEWRLDGRMTMAHNWLHYLWRKQKKASQDTAWTKPNQVDVMHHATTGIVERAIEKRITDILIVTAMFIPLDRIELMRRAGLRVWLLCTESPYIMDQELAMAKACHGVWTNERAAVPAFQAVQPNTAYIKHAWRVGVHDVPPARAYSSDVFFCGSMFPERVKWFSEIDWSGIDFHLYCRPVDVPKRSGLHQFLKGGITPNREMIQLAQKSKIAINLFRAAPVAAESLNPRCYELSAAGVCLVSDERAEWHEKFPDAPVVSSPAATSALLRELLSDESRRQAIAAQQRAAVQSDTWLVRSRQVIEQLTTWQQHAAKGVSNA